MATFVYQAVNQKGEDVRGAVEAESADAAGDILFSRGYLPSKIREKKRGGREFDFAWAEGLLSSVTERDLILFTQQFRTMMRGGLPMMQILQVLKEQTDNVKLQKTIERMAKDINEGSSLNEAFRKHPSVFPDLYCSVVQAGEASGQLSDVLHQLAYIMEHEEKVKNNVKAALRYPLFVAAFLVFAFFVLLIYVIPKFVRIFEKSGIDLPLPTVICLGMYRFFVDHWAVICLTVAGVIVFLFNFLRTDKGKNLKDVLFLKIPFLGPLFLKAAMSRFASIFAILQTSGVPVLESMKILSGTIGNYAISKEIEKVRDKIEKGSSLAAPFKSSELFTPMIVNMIAVGEQSGNLEEMLKEIAEHYDSEVEYAMFRLSEAIGPVLTIFMAVIVGFFALAIFMPIWDLARIVR